MNSKISKKRKSSRSDDTFFDPTDDLTNAYSDNDGDFTKITGSNKHKQKCGFSIMQQADKKPDSRKGIKHKHSDSSAKEKRRVKLKKIESQNFSPTEQNPLLCHAASNPAIITDSQQKSNLSLLPSKTGARKQKSKKVEVKPEKTVKTKQSIIPASGTTDKPNKMANTKQSIIPASGITHKTAKKLKTSGTTAESVDAHTKSSSDKFSQMKQLHSSASSPTHKSSKKLKTSGTTANSADSEANSDKLSPIKQSNSPVSGIIQKSSKARAPESIDSRKKKTKKQIDSISKHNQQKQSKTIATPSFDTNDPMALLMMMEGRRGNPTAAPVQGLPTIPSASYSRAVTSGTDEEQEFDDQDNSTSDGENEGMSDWEEVHDHHMADTSQLPDRPVEITLAAPEILRRKNREKKAFDWKAYLERRVKRFKKEVAADMHKVHLLCLLAMGMRQNAVLNDLTVKAVMLSLLPSDYLTNRKLSAQRQVENLLLWYKRKFSLDNVSHCSNTKLVSASLLIDAVSQGSVTDARVWVLIFSSMLRTIGLTVRLVLSFQPMRFQAHKGWDEKKGPKGKQRRSSTNPQVGEGPSVLPSKTSDKPSSKPKKSQPAPKKAQPAPKKAAKRQQPRRKSSQQAILKNKSALTGYDADDDGDADYVDHDEKMDDDVDNSDSDFSEKGMKKLNERKMKKSAVVNDGSNSRKILSPSTSDDEAAGGKRHGPLGQDVWLEVYFPDSKKWMCFDCFKSQFGKPYSLESSATQPLVYVLGFKNDNSVKDVTARYAKQWLSHTRKNRIDQEWWTQTLFIFDSTPYADNLVEDDEIKSQLLVRPMPTSIAQFKSHPLYALRRHLLKFEAIYPDTAVPLGYVKKEPVYARECVRTLHSRDNWLKEGRLVRLNEEPYKMVKSRPKWKKPKEDPDALDLELFGEWQTEVYIPPPAVNGKVPRNVYGNVELFKPWMLPKGTVQVRGQGLQRVAKKLNIDIAAAMIGWDNHSGFSHPVMDGWVVCEEFADTLMTAWLEDQEIQQQRELEKREKRVYDNWKLLIRGLLIRERLKAKFLQEPTESQQVKEKPETFSDAEDAHDVHFAWPRNRQDHIMQETSKAAQLKTERERKLVEKNVRSGLIVELTEIQDGGKIKTGMGTEDVLVKRKDMSMSESKMKMQELVLSENSSSEDEVVDTRSFVQKQENVKKRRNSMEDSNVKKVRSGEEDEDPDFVVCDKQRKALKTRNSKKKVVTDENSEEMVDQQQDRCNRRRSSLARHAKKEMKYVDETSESDADEVSMKKFVEDVKDDAESDVVDEEVNVSRSDGSKQSRKRMKPGESENQVKVRRKGINEDTVLGEVKSKRQTGKKDHITKQCGGIANNRGTRSHVRCSK